MKLGSFIVSVSAIVTILGSGDFVRAASFETSLSETSADIHISGPIAKGDSEKLKHELSNIKREDRYVNRIFLNSPGGYVAEAIAIGRLLRSNRVATIAPEKSESNNQCASACALIWAAGIYRVGTVEVHRSYIDDEQGGTSFDDWEQALDLSHNAIKEYLSEMRLPESFTTSTFQTKSTSLKSVNAADFGIVFDPIFEEFIISKCGDGLNREEHDVLRLLEDNERYNLNTDVIYAMALRLLLEKKTAYQECAKSQLVRTQMSAQLGK